MRTCSICKIEKNKAEFRVKTNGCLSSFCRECSAAYQKQYQEKIKKDWKKRKSITIVKQKNTEDSTL